MATKVAVVTGSNKGIGFAIVRGLCKQFKGDVYLTARDQTRGLQAVEQLKKEGLNPKFHQLDIEDKKSIETLKIFLKNTYGGLDVLVNNAAIAFKQDSDAPFAVQAETTIRINFTCLLNVCNELFPILRQGARVVHLSSTGSHFFIKRCSEEKCKRLQTANSMDKALALIKEFEKDAKENQHKERGWPESAYGASKMGMGHFFCTI
jgi:carbonyl reductase 1